MQNIILSLICNLCQKYDTTLSRYNSDAHELISSIFGSDVTQKVVLV